MQVMLPVNLPVGLGALRKEQPDRPIREEIVSRVVGANIEVRGFMSEGQD